MSNDSLIAVVIGLFPYNLIADIYGLKLETLSFDSYGFKKFITISIEDFSKALTSLDDEAYNTLILRYQEKLTEKQIAVYYQRPQSKIHHIIVRALKQLKVMMYSHPMNTLDTPIEETKLSKLTASILKRSNISTLEDLTVLDMEDLLKIRNISSNRAQEISSVLESYGYELKKEDELV